LRKSAGSSIVKYIWDGQPHAGEVVNIFHHPQIGIADTILFAEVQWMKNLMTSPLSAGDPWEDFPELEVETWAVNQFWPANSPEVPPSVIPLCDVVSQLCRGDLTTIWL
jgi:hypothetical protein